VKVLEDLGGFDRYKIAYSHDAEKAGALVEIAASALFSLV
jgi:hypothetical protein